MEAKPALLGPVSINPFRRLLLVADLDPVFVELYLHCKTNPLFPLPGGHDAARVFVLDMERKMTTLHDTSQRMLLMRAGGFNQLEIASDLDMSLRTVGKRLQRIDAMPRSWELGAT